MAGRGRAGMTQKLFSLRLSLSISTARLKRARVVGASPGALEGTGDAEARQAYGNHLLRTLEVRGLLVIGRSFGGQAESLTLTQEGQKRAAQLAGSCD